MRTCRETAVYPSSKLSINGAVSLETSRLLMTTLSLRNYIYTSDAQQEMLFEKYLMVLVLCRSRTHLQNIPLHLFYLINSNMLCSTTSLEECCQGVHVILPVSYSSLCQLTSSASPVSLQSFRLPFPKQLLRHFSPAKRL